MENTEFYEFDADTCPLKKITFIYAEQVDREYNLFTPCANSLLSLIWLEKQENLCGKRQFYFHV